MVLTSRSNSPLVKYLRHKEDRGSQGLSKYAPWGLVGAPVAAKGGFDAPEVERGRVVLVTGKGARGPVLFVDPPMITRPCQPCVYARARLSTASPYRLLEKPQCLFQFHPELYLPYTSARVGRGNSKLMTLVVPFQRRTFVAPDLLRKGGQE